MPLELRLNAFARLLSAGLIIALSAGSATADNHPTPDTYPTKVTVEGLLLGRDDISGTAFTGPDDPGDSFILLRPSDLDPNWSGGLRATIEMPLMGRMFQFSMVESADFLGLPDHSLLFGARGLYLGEDLKSIVFDDFNEFHSGGDEIDRMRIETHNRLFGAQIGLQSMRMVAPGDYVGGNVTWVNGVSEAGAQYATVTDADDKDLRDNGSVLFYGATASLVFKLN
ncbi:MAG: hypothetical protein ACTSUY_12250 [Alphaproteobacteria bacterium]